MHQVLLIREILLDIFRHCSPTKRLDTTSWHNADLVALARTCQIFKEPALDVLWETLFDLSPLARCLPEACKFDGQYYSFSRLLSEAEWTTLRGYTRRVRSISSRAPDVEIVVFLAPFIDPLFPNLRSLYWADFKTLPVVHTAVPSLTSLSLSFQFTYDGPLHTEPLDILGERCPSIRQFSAFFPRNEALHAPISRQLCRWKNLQRAECRLANLSMDVILCLPSLSTLQRLSFTLSADLGNQVTHLGSAFVFSNLADLEIHSTSLKSVTALFSRIQLPKIKDLSVSISEYTPRWHVREYWTTLQKACPSNTLARLAFSSSRHGTENLTDPDERTRRPSRLTLDDLLPYKDFGNLRRIDINVAWSVNLTDADLLDLVSTSPHLEELDINKHWGWKMDSEGGITLSGLVQLLRQCPSLCSASLVIDTRTFHQIPCGMDVSFPPRKTFRGTLSFDCLDSNFPPGFDSDYESVFKALRLSIWSSFSDSDYNIRESEDDGDDA